MPLSEAAALSKDEKSGLSPLQHRHFATIATIINEIRDTHARDRAIIAFTRRLPETNPNFNAERFRAACVR